MVEVFGWSESNAAEHHLSRKNDDAFVAKPSLIAVFDGVSGLPNADKASAAAMKHLESIPSILSEDYMRTLILHADREVSKTHGGTTAAIAAPRGDKVIMGSAGDSRIYIIERNNIQCITEDHRVGNAITSALGFLSEMYITTVRVSSGAFILACTDGITDNLNNKEIKEIILKAATVQDAVKTLVRASIKAVRKPDDCTAVILKA